MNETVPSDDRKTGTAQPIFPCTARKAKFETLDYVFYSPSGPVVFPSSLRPGRVGRKTAASAPHSFTLTPAVLVIGCGVLNWRDLTGWRIDFVPANLRHATARTVCVLAVAGLRLADSHRCADGPIFARIPGNRGITERRVEAHFGQ